MSQNFTIGQEIQFVYNNTLRQVIVEKVCGSYILTKDINNPDVFKSFTISRMSCISYLR